MTTKNVNNNNNSNVNKITINIPKPKAPAKPKQKSLAEGEQELNTLEMNDSLYQSRPYTTEVPFNPSMFGFSHLPISRDTTTTTREEPIVSSPEEAPVEAPVEPLKTRKGRGPNKPKVRAVAVAAEPSGYYTDAGYVSQQRGFLGENPAIARLYESVSPDFPARERYIAEAYKQSPLDLKLKLGGGSASSTPRVAKINYDYIPSAKSPYASAAEDFPRTPYASEAESGYGIKARSAEPPKKNPLAEKTRPAPKYKKTDTETMKADREKLAEAKAQIKADKQKLAAAKAQTKATKTTLRGLAFNA